MAEQKSPNRGIFVYGGEAGIRTLGTARFNGFQDRRFRPLSHLSKIYFLLLSTFNEYYT